MTNAALIVCSDAAAPDAENRGWVEVLVTTNGEVVQNHSKFVLDRADLDTCAAQIRANGDKLPLDYDHSYVEGGSTVASGWFTGEAVVLAKGDDRPTGTKATEDELWAEVEWTPQAADDIRSKRFRFISAEFLFTETVKGVKRKVKEFAAATLTNRPFFNRMEAVTLSRATTTAVVWDVSAGYQTICSKLGAALNPPDQADADSPWRYWVRDIDVAGLKALIEDGQEATTYVIAFTLDETGEPTPADPSTWVEAEEQWVSAAKAAESAYTGREATTEGAEMDTTVLAKSLGLADDATEAQITAKLAEVNEQASKAEALAAEVETLKNDDDKSELETLREELKTERTKRIANERAAEFTSAISEGRMLPAEQESLSEVFGDNIDGLRKVLNARPKNATLAREQGSNGDGNDGPAVDETTEEFAAADGTPVDGESAILHAKAIQILGKENYTQDEYLAALKKAERGDAVTA